MKNFLILFVFPLASCFVNIPDQYLGLKDHALVRRSDLYPYTVAILKKSQYISAGALIHENWVLTAADSLFLLQEVIRLIQVRVGTTNYKKGGYTLPCKYFEIHPMFDDSKPQYDIALIRLPEPVLITPSRKPIKMEKKLRMKVLHFTVTAWPAFIPNFSLTSNRIEPFETIKKRRILTVSHLHEADELDCVQMLGNFSANGTESIMCLEPIDENDKSCHREIGAPVAYNGILRGIISSWKPEDCKPSKNLMVVNVVTSPTIRNWIHSVIHHNTREDSLDDDYGSKCPVSDYKEHNYVDSEKVDYEETYNNYD